MTWCNGSRAEGQVYLDEQPLYEKNVDVVDVRRRIGMVFQRPNPFPKSIYDNVAYGPRLYGIRGKASWMHSWRNRCGRRPCGTK